MGQHQCFVSCLPDCMAIIEDCAMAGNDELIQGSNLAGCCKMPSNSACCIFVELYASWLRWRSSLEIAVHLLDCVRMFWQAREGV